MKKYIAELIGTYTLVFCGTGAVVINEVTHGAVTHVGVAITFGLVVMSLIYALGNISGAHINPAVSIGFAAAGLFPVRLLFPYIISQITGALLASATIKALFPQDTLLGSTIPAGNVWQSFVLEILLTFFLMLVILQVSTGSKERGIIVGLAVGSVVLAEALFAGPISGASMNPARSLAPAIISGHLQYVWIYLTAPVLGVNVAVLVWKYLKA